MTEAPEMQSNASLSEEIRGSTSSDNIISTRLKTDERVIARVTDGIYRQPASAIRELISNAYDADASRVVIKTDAPRFERISIEDNGHGMTPEALAHMLQHIGSSSKRSKEGTLLGVTNKKDPTLSPKGRKLIGKIGIGIFSVSQLTHTFQIITKTKGDNFRTIATVAMKQYDDNAEISAVEEFEAGKVKIWREKASDIETHGTTIVLTNIRPQARDTLRSREIWSAIEQSELAQDDDQGSKIDPPKFHMGRVDKKTGDIIKSTRHVPWKNNDTPDEAFSKLVQVVWNESEFSQNPRLNRIFDYYLFMVWQLSLAVPVSYVDGHIFDTASSNWLGTYLLSNKPKGAAEAIDVSGKQTPREILNLENITNEEKFDVLFDNLKLQHPIKYKNLPEPVTHALKKPLVFLGKCEESFAKVPRELSGGPLKFEAYLFWYPKIAPTDHQGSLIRIHGASGTLFDPSFMRYQVAEQTRLRQITCEIFVSEGFDSALNIDRESFNDAHPHAVYITKWLHGALRQLATAQKRVASEIRGKTRDKSQEQAKNEIQKIAFDVWSRERDDPDSTPPAINIDDERAPEKKTSKGYTFERKIIVPQKGIRKGRNSSKQDLLDEKIKAIAQILASYGVLEDLSKKKQESLLRAIYEILEASNE